MKICFVLPSFPSRPIGGFKIVYQYANELVKRGHVVRVIHPYFMPNHPFPTKLYAKMKVYLKKIIYTKWMPSPPSFIDWQHIDPRVEMRYVPYLNEKFIPDNDAIIATAWHTAEMVNSLSNRKGKKFYFIQGYETWSGPEDRVHRTWLYPMKKIVISSWLKQIGEKLGAEDITLVPNAIDHNKYFKINEVSNRPKRIAMLYHKGKWKGSTDGIRALELVKQQIPDIEAVLFGYPERTEEIPEWIEYIQNPSHEELVFNIYNGSAIYVCPSLSEGWGLPVAEAMACGCAVVSTENGGVQDFAIHEETALLSPIKDPKKLANNIIRLLRDEKLRVKLAYAGNEKIKQFNFNRSTDLFEKVLKNELSY